MAGRKWPRPAGLWEYWFPGAPHKTNISKIRLVPTVASAIIILVPTFTKSQPQRHSETVPIRGHTSRVLTNPNKTQTSLICHQYDLQLCNQWPLLGFVTHNTLTLFSSSRANQLHQQSFRSPPKQNNGSRASYYLVIIQILGSFLLYYPRFPPILSNSLHLSYFHLQ